MKKSKYLIVALAAAVVLGGSLSAKAVITLQLQDATSRAQTGITSAGTAGANIAGNELIGIYRFNGTGSEGPANPFWSTCLSPNGNLDWGTHNYTSMIFESADPGRNPAAWAGGTTADYGIQNAQYLWRAFSPTIIASGNANQGTGLALAMYVALYDSTAYGQYTYSVNSGAFYITSTLLSGVSTAMNSYLSALNPTSVSANLGNGYILRSTETGAGQDLIWNVTPVPEPTTMIAGALLLLPFGASTLRMLRKSRKA